MMMKMIDAALIAAYRIKVPVKNIQRLIHMDFRFKKEIFYCNVLLNSHEFFLLQERNFGACFR